MHMTVSHNSNVADDQGLSQCAELGNRDRTCTSVTSSSLMAISPPCFTPCAEQVAVSPLPSENISHEGSVYDLDMNSICGTPLPFVSVTPFQSRRLVFDNSTDRFYFLPSKAREGHHPHHYPRTAPTPLSPLHRSILHLKNSEETCSLAEKCFTLKVTPLTVLTVLYARRKTDDTARCIIQQLPSAVLEQLSAGVGIRTAECAVL